MKTDEERGPLGAWAYNTRVALNLSPETVVKELGKYDPATIRKAEADSEDMSRPLWRALLPYYQGKARELGFILSPVPAFGEIQQEPPADLAALIAAMTRNTDTLNAILIEMRDVNDLQRQLVIDLGKTDRERLEQLGFQVLPTDTASDTHAAGRRGRRGQPTNDRAGR